MGRPDLTAADRDSDAPRLYLGQAQGDTSDMNQSSLSVTWCASWLRGATVVFTVRGDGAAAEKTFTMAQLKAARNNTRLTRTTNNSQRRNRRR